MRIKPTAVAYFKAVSLSFPEYTDNNYKTLQQIQTVFGLYSIQEPLKWSRNNQAHC